MTNVIIAIVVAVVSVVVVMSRVVVHRVSMHQAVFCAAATGVIRVTAQQSVHVDDICSLENILR